MESAARTRPGTLAPWRLVFSLWAAVVLTLLAARWEFYFASPVHEHGDTALNALQIGRAKEFAELHGNYSRFRFHHPGPAFFYVYAMAERVLCDWLPTGLTPFNAHSLAGLALQGFFFALGVGLFAQWLERPGFVPLALLAAAVHFSLAGSSFWSIWPPHVLLMPFFAFWVACVSVASGRLEHGPWIALAGSFLVHGHVAQPLFVVTLAAGAYLWAWRSGGVPWRKSPRAHVIAAIVLGLFILPLALDLLRGAESNFAEILRHVRDNAERTKKPLKAVLYVLSFFGYVRNQDEALRELSVASLSMFSIHWPAFAVWAVLGCGAFLGWRAERRATGRSAFWLRFGVFWVSTAVLTVVWSIVQTGRMFEFNTYFFHAVSLLAVFPLLSWVSGKTALVQRPYLLRSMLLLAAAGIAYAGFHRPALNAGEAGLARKAAVKHALAPNGDPRPVLLVFEGDLWPEAASVALELQRSGVPYHVDAPWEFMHSGRAVDAALIASWPPDLRLWRVVPTLEGMPGLPLDEKCVLLVGTQEASIPMRVDFRQPGLSDRYIACGIARSYYSGASAWLSQPQALIEFSSPPVSQPVAIRLEITRVHPSVTDPAPLEIYFDGRQIHRAPVKAPGQLEFFVPAEIWNANMRHALRLHLPGARNPEEPSLPSDWRGSSVALGGLSIGPAR